MTMKSSCCRSLSLSAVAPAGSSIDFLRWRDIRICFCSSHLPSSLDKLTCSALFIDIKVRLQSLLVALHIGSACRPSHS
ncbi:unnamed protein product [Linum trigynum]|uniref:Secreted protein n=1 Tax=Linum trigynum TaxID=586398 RepID=A0AAV2ETB1_9ROSI